MNDIAFGYLHCGRKKRYRTQAKAEVVACRMRKKYRKTGGNIYPYYCKICGGWHNGHSTVPGATEIK